MLILHLMFALAIQDAPQPATPADVTQAQPGVQVSAEDTARAAAPRPRGRNGEALVCHERAPTGSVMRRTMCRSERRAAADRSVAQTYVAEVTAGRVNEPDPTGGPR